ncbi:unnamed protein product, partial [Rotaria sp. Silwood1]
SNRWPTLIDMGDVNDANVRRVSIRNFVPEPFNENISPIPLDDHDPEINQIDS